MIIIPKWKCPECGFRGQLTSGTIRHILEVVDETYKTCTLDVPAMPVMICKCGLAVLTNESYQEIHKQFKLFKEKFKNEKFHRSTWIHPSS